MTDPAALDAAAAALVAQAGAMPRLLDRALARSGVNVWQGPAQAHLADDLATLRRALGAAADELYAVAARLRAQAAAARGPDAAAPAMRRVV